MKKKIITSSLLIGSLVSIIPHNFIFNNKNYQIKNMENKNINEKEEVSNAANVEERDIYIDPLYDKNYATLFSNNLTNTVVSPNKEIPGFLGAWDTDSIGTFPDAIGWTTPNLFLSWSANLIDHPSLEGQVPSGFNPGLVTALHSDNKYSTDKKNQVFAIVANTANLAAREYWILRYNTLDGSPIKDDNSKMPKMSNSPIPEMTAENGNGSAFALANDTINNRYLAFYPGRLGDLKNDIFGFKINNENKIEWLENKTHFSGHSNWFDVPYPYFFDYSDENIVIGLAPFNTKRSPSDGSSLALMVAINPPLIVDKDNYHFKVLNFQDNLAANMNFKGEIITGRTSGDFNNEKATIAVPKTLLPLSHFQKNINPNLQLFNFVDNLGNETYKVQMVVPILKDNEWIYMYLSSIFDNVNNSYHISWQSEGTLSQGSFFRSSSFGTNPMPPNISYSEIYPNEILISSNANTTDPTRISTKRFIFDTLPNNGPWDPNSLVIDDISSNSTNEFWFPKHFIIKDPHLRNHYIWSLSSGFAVQYIINESGQKAFFGRISNGGIKHESFQETASRLGWLEGQANTKLPSQITPQELETIGSSTNDFFKIPRINYPSGITASPPEIKLFGETIKDDQNGTIKGTFTLTHKFIILSESYDFEVKIPFMITGLNYKNDVPTSINQNDLILNNLPSDLTPTNIPNFIDLIAVPNGATADNWTITNKNNAAGTATISVDVNPHFDDDGILTNSSKTISINVSGLKKMSGTNITKTSAIIPSDKTVWDFSPEEASKFIEVKDLIPNSSSNSITYSIQDQKPLIGELTILTTISSGSYYDPNNNGLPSVSGNPPLELPLTFNGFKKIPNTGTIVTPGTGPYIDILPSSINDTNIIDYITIENAVPGSLPKFSNITPNDESTNSAEWFVSFDIFFEKEYDTNGNIINGQTKTYQIRGFEVVTEKNYLTPIIFGSIGGGIFLILLIIILIILLWKRKNKVYKPVTYGPKSSPIVSPSQNFSENLYKPEQMPEIIRTNDNIVEPKNQPPRTILKEPRTIPFSEMSISAEASKLRPSPTLERANTSKIPKSSRPTTPYKR
ncbi:MAG: hypothetical protein ACRDCD_00325 [Mycoplasmoidaceae bacterium]